MTTYFVAASDANSGDVNTGARDKPFTQSEAMTLANRKTGGAQPGDTFLFLGGTYRNATYGDGNVWKDTTDTLLKLNEVHGAEGAPITFAAAPGETVKLQYDGNGAIVLRGCSYIRIDGFDIEGPNGQISLQDALDNQYLYRIPVGTDAGGNTIYEEHYRDPTEVLDHQLSDDGAQKPQMYNSAAISMPAIKNPDGSQVHTHHIEIVDNSIHDTPAQAISAQGGNDYVTISGNQIYNTTWYSSNGNHAIEFKFLDSLDASDAAKIFVTNNTFRDNYNLMISWVPTKTFVTRHIDEGKDILVQESVASPDVVNGYVWDHGRVVVANNAFTHSGNAIIDVQTARGVDVLNNTIVDPDHIATLLAQEQVAGSPFAGTFTDPATGQQVAGFFAAQQLETGWTLAGGAIRLASSVDVRVYNNLISISDPTQFAIDASAHVTSANTQVEGNIYAGGAGVRIRSEATVSGPLTAGFTAVADLGLVDAAHGDYRLLAGSAAVDAGVASPTNPETGSPQVTDDITGTARSDGQIDVGAYEFMPVTDASGIAQLDAQGFLLDVSNPASGLVGTTMPNGLPVWSAYQIANRIARPNTWADFESDFEITYSFAPEFVDTAGGGAAFDAAYQAITRQIFQFYAEISGLTFREVTGSTAPNIHFENINQFGGGGWAYTPDSGIRYVGIGYPWTAGDVNVGSYVYNTIVHEVGHALGLNHPGTYNGSHVYPDQSVYWNDTEQYSVMSYEGEATSGGSFGNPATPMLHDILAIQLEYGANTATRTGNTVYGYNNTSGTDAYDLTYAAGDFAFSVWDGGGNDTLDFSGSASGTVLDLRQGGFSSVNGHTYNVSIAYGAVVENGIGSGSADRMRGNEVGNRLEGGAGNDTIYGGSDTPAVAAVNPRDFTGIGLNEAPLTRNQYLSITRISAFSGAAFTWEQLVKITRIPNSLVALASYATSSQDNAVLIEGTSDGFIRITIANKAAYVTDISTLSLVDGNPHRLSVSWDKATGAVRFYVDGALAHSGTYTASIDATINSGGTLVVGQEQDSIGGGFNAAQVFQGTVGDIRIFDDVRTAQEIADNAFTTLTSSEQGLVNNWQVQTDDTNQIADVVPHVVPASVDLTTVFRDMFEASQTSTWSNSSTYAADRVLDDSTSTYSHTGENQFVDQRLQIDFARPFSITSIELVNRGSFGSRLNGCVVCVLDAQGAVLHTFAPIANAASGQTLTFTLPSAMVASAVRVDNDDQDHLQIAEINIFGPIPAGLDPNALTVKNGATVVSTAPAVDLTPDNDTLAGGAGNDRLFGGAGHDALSGGTGPVSPFTPVYGIDLNQGVTDQYLVAANYGGLAGTSNNVRFTIELLVSGLSGYNELLSYANDQSSNAFGVTLPNNGNIQITYRGSTLTTGVAASKLADGGTHRFSLTWDNKSFVIYIDGASEGSGTHTSTSTSLNGGGTLIFGQEQDSLGGGFQSSQIINGTIGDIRIFNDVRTAGEIAANAFAPLADPVGEQGLVSNWQVAANSITGGSVADAHGGAALVVASVNGTTPALDRIGAWDDDTLTGGIGNDTLTGGFGNDSLDGGADFDIGDWSDVGIDQTFVLGEGGSGTYSTAASGTDTYSSIEGVQLGRGHDRLTGNSTANELRAGDGRDTLAGGLGNDTLDGGLGSDWVDYSASTTASLTVWVGASGHGDNGDAAGESDTLTSVENVVGSNFADRLYGDTTDNVFRSSRGADIISGGGGADGIDYANLGGGVYVMLRDGYAYKSTTAGASYTTPAAAGAYEVDKLTGISNAYGSGFNDRLYGTTGNNVFRPGAGADIVYGLGGSDTIDYSDAAGGVFVSLTSNPQTLADINGYAYETTTAGASYTNPATVGATTKDTLIGIANIVGSAFNDRFYGTTGDNVFRAGAGADYVYGLGGNDTIDYSDAAGGVFVVLGDSYAYEATTAGASYANAATVGATTKDYLTGLSNATGSDFDDRLYGSATANALVGGAGNDMLYALAGADLLSGGDGADKLIGGDASDTLTGGAGADGYYFLGSETGGADLVTDFSAADGDGIYLRQGGFGSYVAGDSVHLETGAGLAAPLAAGFAFDTASAALRFDADGSGGAAAIHVATLQGVATLSSDRLVVYAG